MMKSGRLLKQLLIWVLALQVINSSVDSPELLPAYLPENLAYNEQESIAEFLFEKILHFDNVITEHDEDESEEEGMWIKKATDRISIYLRESIQLILLPESSVIALESRPVHWANPDPRGVLQPPKR